MDRAPYRATGREVHGRQTGIGQSKPDLFQHSTGESIPRSSRSARVLQQIRGHAGHETMEHYMHVNDTDVLEPRRRHSPLDRL